MNVIRDVLAAHYQLPMLSCVGLLLFMGVFTGTIAWIFRSGSREVYSRLSDLPLQDHHQDGETQS
ncbi:MAG: cbb3-type cytochrome c oxidase subunit 3 [Oligoflexia bacterium]|nr:cbb3-type cytochrome c oxidase subunit 3 [Oligoflexia bacterium]